MNDQHAAEVANHFRPSDYTAALVQCLLTGQAQTKGARVLDVGCGSGVLLAAAGAAGAAQLTGIDIEEDAVAATTALLDHHGYAAQSDIHRGEMFAPVGSRRFDLVLANLPHFPMDRAANDGRLLSWSVGGGDGRNVLDRFLNGLATHLALEGQALVVHNEFIGIEQTRKKAASTGLSVRVINTFMVPLSKEKLVVMSPDVLVRETGHSIHCFGGYAFGSVAILCLTHSAHLGCDP